MNTRKIILLTIVFQLFYSLVNAQIKLIGNITTNGTVSAVGNITTSNTLIADTVIANTVITTGTSSAFRLPNLTQLQINSLSPQNGDMVYNTTENYPEIYQNGEWKIFTLSFYS